MTRVVPKIDPQFHIYEIDAGAGSSIKVDDMVLDTGWCIKVLFFIKKLFLLI